MNERQKEVLASQLKDEQRVLKELKQVYTKAREDVISNIKALEGRTDVENLQAIVYQKNYQEALKKQLDAILDAMNAKQFTTISDYLGKSYEEGFFGVLYDLHGQGIPLIFPIDQEQATRAIQLDSKISEGLYERLGVDTKLLKNAIRANVSRGIASSTSWAQVARNIQNRMNVGMNRAFRIARTEGHRIQNESRFDAQTKAKQSGADVVKQWDSTLDKRTRPTHQQLDGQIREIDEPFEIPSNGRKGMYPGGFGVAAEDINCRCASLQRARWALDDDELQTLKDRAVYFGLDKTESFNDFKTKYLRALRGTSEKSEYTENVRLEVDDFPEGFKKKQTQKFIDYVNGVEGADPEMISLYKSMGSIENVERNGITFNVSYTMDGHQFVPSYRIKTNEYVEAKLKIPKMEGDDLRGQAGTTAHEIEHLIDFYGRENTSQVSKALSERTQPLTDALNNAKDKPLSAKVENMFKKSKGAFDSACELAKKEYDSALEALRNKNASVIQNMYGNMTAYKAYRKQADELWRDYVKNRDYLGRNAMDGMSALEDIYDAISSGTRRDNGVVLYGHGSKYYRLAGNRESEVWANYCSLSLTKPELIDVLREDQPELVSALEGIKQQFLRMAGK